MTRGQSGISGSRAVHLRGTWRGGDGQQGGFPGPIRNLHLGLLEKGIKQPARKPDGKTGNAQATTVSLDKRVREPLQRGFGWRTF